MSMKTNGQNILHIAPKDEQDYLPPSGQPTISIVISTSSQKEALRQCLSAIYGGTCRHEIEVLVVDDASNDGTSELLKDEFEKVLLLRNLKCRGNAASINQALAQAKGMYVLILNPEAQITQNALQELFGFAKDNADAGIIGPCIVDSNGVAILNAHALPTITSLLTQWLRNFSFRKHIDRRNKKSANTTAHAGPDEVECVPGACIFIKRKLLDEIGLLDERILEGPLDADLCLRAKSHGWKICYNPKAVAVYEKRRAAKTRSVKQAFRKIWGSFYFFQKHSYLVSAKNRDHAIIMPRAIEQVLLFTSDFVAIVGSYIAWSMFRGLLGFFTLETLPELFITALWIFGYWFLVFMFFGLYRTWYAFSRIDEVFSVFKAVFWGVIFIFILTFEASDLSSPRTSRLLIISYWLLMTFMVATGRGLLRTIQRRMLEAGIGLRRTLIVGWNKKARSLHEKVKRFPALGYRVVGFIDTASAQERQSFESVPVIGSISDLGKIVIREDIEEILIALSWQQRKYVMAVISQCADKDIKLNIIPDLYGIVMGRARTNQIYGVPLIEILPEHLAPWEKKTKRLIDIAVSACVLLIGLPFWLLVALLVKLDTPGPVLYAQKRVGMKGKAYHMFKYRSMVKDAEKLSGPKWADKDDPRMTKIGKWLRKTRIDEIPQFWNVLKGEMSLVGPRPERPYFVEKLRKKVPLYTRRLRVRPGISGWAQIKGDYDATVDDVKQKLQYDIFYLENMSLRLDFKILLMTLYVVLRGRGQ
ncbi:MAG: exopolysaccharide biosynthesis polyprenyl glycosylphosphotransferase [bacterium]